MKKNERTEGHDKVRDEMDLTEIELKDKDVPNPNFSYLSCHGRDIRLNQYEMNEILGGGSVFTLNEATEFMLTKLLQLWKHRAPKKFTYCYDRGFLNSIVLVERENVSKSYTE